MFGLFIVISSIRNMTNIVSVAITVQQGREGDQWP
jgi:hypothetical protein